MKISSYKQFRTAEVQMLNSYFQKVSRGLFLGILLSGLSHFDTAQAEPLESLNLQMSKALSAEGFYKWEFDLTHRCANCELKIFILDPKLKTKNVIGFIETLENKKTEIMELYGHFDSDYYNRLALMALGILGNESQFFKSKKYLLKENFPLLVTGAKLIRNFYTNKKMSANSQGPTQIKIIPTKIAEKYQLTMGSLHQPDSAALATMGFLIESFQELNNRHRMNQIATDWIEDFEYYLPYLYFGKTRALVDGTATPMSNMYVKSMRAHMKKFELYQRYR